MAGIVTAALALADAAGLDDWVVEKLRKSDSGAARLATEVVDLAKQATGATRIEKARQDLSKHSDSAEEFKRLLAENDYGLWIAAYEDVKDARRMYEANNEQADLIASQIVRYNALYILIALISNALAVYYLKDSGAVLAALSNVLGMAIKSLFDERKDVTGFYFGSSADISHRDRGRPK